MVCAEVGDGLGQERGPNSAVAGSWDTLASTDQQPPAPVGPNHEDGKGQL